MCQRASIVIFFVIYGISICLSYSVLHKVFEETVNIPCETSLDCEFDEVCNANSFCQCRPDKECSTNNSAVHNIVTTKVGESCHSDRECNIQNALCDISDAKDARCRCSDGYVVSTSGKMCLKAVHSLADPCVEDTQCNKNIANAVCLQNICVCAHDMHDYNNTCHKDTALGESCQYTPECVTPYSECHNNVCSCSRRYIPSNDKQQCLLAANSLLSPCKRDEQCVATLGSGSHCFNDLCNCMYMFQFKASVKKCVKDMTLGELCSTHSDCHQPGSDPSRLICILNECQCKTPDFVQEHGNCIESSGGQRKPWEKVPALSFILFFLGKLLLQ